MFLDWGTPNLYKSARSLQNLTEPQKKFCGELGAPFPKDPCTQINNIYFGPKVPIQGLLYGPKYILLGQMDP